jgi:hypothetical protein
MKNKKEVKIMNDLKKTVMQLEKEKEMRKKLQEPIEVKVSVPRDLYRVLLEKSKLINDGTVEKVILNLIISGLKYKAPPIVETLYSRGDSSDALMTALLRKEQQKVEHL